MSNFIGNKEIVSMYLGNNDITSFSIGNKEIWNPEPVMDYTPARYFKFNGNTLMGFSTEGQTLYDAGELTELNLPSSYSIGGSTEITYTKQDIENIFDDDPFVDPGMVGDYFNYNFTISSEEFGTIVIETTEDFDDHLAEIDMTLHDANDYTIVAIEEHYTDGNDYSVTSIGASAFYNCSGLTSITIPDGVISIETYAFNGCSGLTSITISSSVTSIGNSAFSACTSLNTIVIPNSVTTIRNAVFKECINLSSVSIGSGVSQIGGEVFYGCTNLSEINVDANNTYYKSVDGVLFTYSQTNLIRYPTNKANISYTIPNTVLRIETDAFGYCHNLEEIDIPNSVTTISNAFAYCENLTSITIPSSVNNIAASAFYSCTGLITAYIYSTSSLQKAATIYSGWFGDCTAELFLHIPATVTSPTSAYGEYWNWRSPSEQLSYVADL